MINSLTKSDTAEQAKTNVDKVMSVDVACLDRSKTAGDAASFMTTSVVGSVIITVKNRPVDVVTE